VVTTALGALRARRESLRGSRYRDSDARLGVYSFLSIVEAVDAHAAASTVEADAAGLGSFRTYRSRRVAS